VIVSVETRAIVPDVGMVLVISPAALAKEMG
jgi:hypothetical protein